MGTSRLCLIVAAATVCALLPVPGVAQEVAPTFEGLPPAPGTEIRITRTDGSRIRGRFEKPSGQAFDIRVRGNTVSVPRSSILRIEQRRPESKLNGLLIGLAAGAGTGFLVARQQCGNDSECSFYATAAYVPLFAGIGAGAGTLIDFAIKRYDGVYSRTTAFQIGVRLPIP
jgi:hypothetical protein